MEGHLSVCVRTFTWAGGDVFYYGDWIRKPGVTICSCNDGLRPVIFKLEAADEADGLYAGAVNKRGGRRRKGDQTDG